jgi:hypothetical protein
MVRAFEDILGFKVIVPEYHMVMGAYGAAMLALEANAGKSRYRGDNIWTRDIHTRGMACEDCPNNCEIIEIIDTGEVVGRTGGRCGKW